MQLVTWVAVFVLSVLIVASRKHYTVDVVVAWYVVPLVFYAMHRRWTTKRPIQDEWPHRPLAEDTELAEVVVDDQGSKGSEGPGKQVLESVCECLHVAIMSVDARMRSWRHVELIVTEE